MLYLTGWDWMVFPSLGILFLSGESRDYGSFNRFCFISSKDNSVAPLSVYGSGSLGV